MARVYPKFIKLAENKENGTFRFAQNAITFCFLSKKIMEHYPKFLSITTCHVSDATAHMVGTTFLHPSFLSLLTDYVQLLLRQFPVTDNLRYPKYKQISVLVMNNKCSVAMYVHHISVDIYLFVCYNLI